jgi:hypothetical protein
MVLGKGDKHGAYAPLFMVLVLGKGDKQVLKRISRHKNDLLCNELKPFLQVLYALVL